MRKEMWEIAELLRDQGHAAGANRVETMADLLYEQGAIPADLEGHVLVTFPQREAAAAAETFQEWEENPTNVPGVSQIVGRYKRYEKDGVEGSNNGTLTPAFAQTYRTALGIEGLSDETTITSLNLFGDEWDNSAKVAVNVAVSQLRGNDINTIGALRAADYGTLLDIRSIGVGRAVFLKYTTRRGPNTPTS